MRFVKHMVGIALLALGPAAFAADQCGLPGSPEGPEQSIAAIEQAWLTAEFHGDVQFLDCLLAPGYQVIAAKTGEKRSKAQLLERVANNKGKTTAVPALSTVVAVNGNFATALSSMKGTKANGESYEATYVDSYALEDGVWRAVGGVDF